MAYWSNIELIPFLITYSISFIVLLIGSISDLKTREVADWINYNLIISGLCLNLLFTSVYGDPKYIINSMIGLAIFFGIAYIMFYAGQWGGGDSKMLMGLGSMIGIDISFSEPQFLAGFFVNILLVGALYGLLWSLLLILNNRKKFSREFKKRLAESKVVLLKNFLLIFLIAVFAYSFFARQDMRIILWGILLLVLVTFYLWISIRAVEKISMYKSVEPSRLTEGDWIVNDIYVGKEYIAGPKDLGIEKKQIKRLVELYKKGKVKKVLVKEGIPFVPSFFISFLATLFFGNLIWFLI